MTFTNLVKDYDRLPMEEIWRYLIHAGANEKCAGKTETFTKPFPIRVSN